MVRRLRCTGVLPHVGRYRSAALVKNILALLADRPCNACISANSQIQTNDWCNNSYALLFVMLILESENHCLPVNARNPLDLPIPFGPTNVNTVCTSQPGSIGRAMHDTIQRLANVWIKSFSLSVAGSSTPQCLVNMPPMRCVPSHFGNASIHSLMGSTVCMLATRTMAPN